MKTGRDRFPALGAALALAGAGVAGCAYGATAAGIALLTRTDDDAAPAPGRSVPAILVTSPSGNQWGDVSLGYVLIDGEGDPASLSVQFSMSTDGGASWTPFATATERPGPPSEGVAALATSPVGVAHLFVWDSASDVGAGVSALARLRCTPSDPAGSGVPVTSATFPIDNGTPTAVPVTPLGNQSNDVALSYTLQDPESDAADLQVTFEVSTDGGSSWTAPAPATESTAVLSEGTTGLSASPAGITHVFVWNSFADVGGITGLARLTVIPADPGPPVRGGTPGTSATAGFPLLNKRIATVVGGGTGVLNFPAGVARDASGNVYVADTFNHRVQVLNTQAGAITVAGVVIGANQLGVIAGTGVAGFNSDHQVATSAQLNFPTGLALDASGNVFVADSLNHRVRRVDRTTGFITTVAGTGNPGRGNDGGLATAADLREPRSLTFDGAGNLYIADTKNHMIRVVNTQSTSITVPPNGGIAVAPNCLARVCGDGGGGAGNTGDGGFAQSARLREPADVAFDSNGHLYVVDRGNHVLRAVSFAAAGNITIAGTTVGAGRIDTVVGTNPSTGGFSGDGGAAAACLLRSPEAVRLDANDDIILADTGNSRIRFVNAQGSTVSVAGVSIATNDIDTVAGGGASPGPNEGDGAAATAARLHSPGGVTVFASGHLGVADTGIGRLRFVNVGTGSVSVAGVTVAGGDIDTLAGVTAPNLSLLNPAGIARLGNLVFVADELAHRVYQVDLITGATAVVAGTGTNGFAGDGAAATAATLDQPRTLALDGAGNLYIADWKNNRVRAVNRQGTTQTLLGVSVAAGAIQTVAGGQSGSGTGAQQANLSDTPGIALDGGGNLIVAHAGSHRIRRVDASTGALTDVAGINAGYVDGAALTAAKFDEPSGVWLDGANVVVVDGRKNHAVRYVNLGAGAVVVCGVAIPAGAVGTIIGDPPATGPTKGYNGDNQQGTATLLDGPTAALRLPVGDLLVVDAGNQRIRRVSQSTGLVSTIAGTGTAGFNGDGIPPSNAHLNGPSAFLLDTASPPNVFFCDSGNRRVRRFTP